jgi:hypothetical protein
MKMKEKAVFIVLGLLIFFFSGGVACTYGGTGTVDPILAVALGLSVFFTVGAAACTIGGNRVAKQKTNKVSAEA